jgi:hypothetical protein
VGSSEIFSARRRLLLGRRGGGFGDGQGGELARPGDAFSGTLAEVVLYDSGLNTTEVARLAMGASPL